jgi:bifunctional DNA-binding transcriptional regulator/antitoxin component of YhaV-PrlF toxin-antitoxin module
MQKSRVGSKGELFPPKEIRKQLGLYAHTGVVYSVEDGRLIVEPIPTLEEVLSKKPSVEITLEEVKKSRNELSTKAEK